MAYSQEDYWKMLSDPAGFRQFMTDWAMGANGGAATHQIAGANNQGLSSYEQVLADLAARGFDTTGLAQHVTAQPVAANDVGAGLDPGYEAAYQDQLRAFTSDRDAQLAANDYARSLAQQRGTRQLGDLAQSWNTAREKLPGSYIQRGAFGSGSGIYQQGLQNYATDRLKSQTDATDAYNEALRSYDQKAQDIQMADQRRRGDLAFQRQSRYSGTAAQLAAAKPFTV